MTLRTIARLGHPVLISPATPVERPDDAELQQLIDDMIETMAAADGIGLAAPQVHASRRVIVARRIAERPERHAGDVIVLLNPILTPIDDETVEAYEGCLSIPELRGYVPRHRRVAFRGLDRQGHPMAGEAEDLFARILQHEVDHLDGILFPMRMPDLRHLALAEELPHLRDWMEAQRGRS
jgi:peptide deformylase